MAETVTAAGSTAWQYNPVQGVDGPRGSGGPGLDRTLEKQAPLDGPLLGRMQRYWEALNYLTAGQIYLLDNPLLRAPLHADHIKPRLLGHWGTSPGLNLITVQVQRLISERNQRCLYVAGPGHGGPALNAASYLDGTYSAVHPDITQDEEGIRLLFRQFSTPGGIPSHCGPHVPNSLHEGGELGYALLHAFGAAFDNPDLLVACVVGDGEAETAPLEGSWKSIRFLDPARDGAVLPILHLNGYKISGPTVQARITETELADLLRGHGWKPFLVEGDDPATVHQWFAATLDHCHAEIRALQAAARSGRPAPRPAWPMIVLRTPKGWTGPKVVDGLPVEGTFRAHQVPVTDVRTNPEHLAILEAWLRSYRPETIFDAGGRLEPDIASLVPPADLRLGASPQANGGRVVCDLDMPDWTEYRLDVPAPGTTLGESTRRLGLMLRDVMRRNEDSFLLFGPDETNSNRLGAVFEVTNRRTEAAVIPTDDHLSPSGRVFEVLSEHCCEGWLEGYVLSGRHGLWSTYEAFAQVVDSMLSQHAKWLEQCSEFPWRRPLPSLNILLTSHVWQQEHNGFSHQAPGFVDNAVMKRSAVARIYFPPDANTLLAVMDHCLRSRNYVNVVTAGKAPALQWLTEEEARAHCARGASTWEFASNDGGNPDVVLAAAGDVPTLETCAAAWLLRRHVPDLRVRVVNVVDLCSLMHASVHPHGLDEIAFDSLFGADTPVIFAHHGYPWAIHGAVHGRPNEDRFHVHGYRERGTTTTPFDMVVMNEASRYHLALNALRRVSRLRSSTGDVADLFNRKLYEHTAYTREHFVDMPEIADWRWTP